MQHITRTSVICPICNKAIRIRDGRVQNHKCKKQQDTWQCEVCSHLNSKEITRCEECGNVIDVH